MSNALANPVTRAEVAVPFRASPVLHPDYTYWSQHWEMIRDAEIGEVEVKRKRAKYLPKMPTHDSAQYDAYLRRAVFFNMTARTLNALYGTVFRRNPNVTGLTPALREKSKHITKEGMSLHLLAKTTVKEVLAVGRYGMLVDANPDGTGDAYVACYSAENILDWEMAEINGRWQLARVTLRELYYDRDGHWAPYDFKSRFRILMLSEIEGRIVYEQFIYEDIDSFNIPDLDQLPSNVVTPTVRGETLDYIPFVCVGPFTNYPDVQKPPMLDIVTLNFAHYYSYAQLEHGRFYTASPTFWVQDGSGNSQNEYTVGPDTVWILDTDERAGIMEFNGGGLRYLESALSQKEGQIASIGGRMMPGTSRGAAESDNSLMMQEKNEQTLLLNISDTADEALTQILHWWADWNNASKTAINKISFELNRDFLIKDAGAREFRAVHQMYADGVLPAKVVFDYLKRFEVIPEWMEEEEYLKLIQDEDQFPNMVDVLARMKDFPDAKSFHEFRVLKASTQVQPNAGDPQNVGVPEQAKQAQAVKKKGDADA